MSNQNARERGRIILAHGEVTGHMHEVVDVATELPPDMDVAQFFEVDGQRELIVLAPCSLVHPEHGRIALDPDAAVQARQGDVLLDPTGPGHWIVRQQQEWAGPDAWRKVAD